MPPSRRLFGTDGVRGVANRDLTPELALAIGRALGGRLPDGARVLIGRDTRRSGPMLEGALAAGLASAGADVGLLGVLPTPAVAELVGVSDAAAGAVISASHNPFPDNGIKLFGPDGFKLADAEEAAVEAALDGAGDRPEGGRLGAIDPWEEARALYVESLLERRPVDLSGLSIVVDCANGATAVTAPEVLERLGARVTAVGVEPDGVNINVGCGSTDLALVAATVREAGADLGLAFDGDGDRVLAVGEDGVPLDGDQIIAICALEMRRGGYALGGEQSGHVINLRHGPSGDGLAAGLHLLEALAARGETLAEAGRVMQRLPQRLVNVSVERKGDLDGAEALWAAVRECEAALGEDGRVVVRASGTEPLVRVMVEAPTADECDTWCATIAEVAARELGGRLASSADAPA